MVPTVHSMLQKVAYVVTTKRVFKVTPLGVFAKLEIIPILNNQTHFMFLMESKKSNSGRYLTCYFKIKKTR